MKTIPCDAEGCNTPSLGGLLDSILVRFAEIALFPPASSDAERKAAITSAFDAGELTDRQTSMLIASFNLRDA